jgi:hypothetical protein
MRATKLNLLAGPLLLLLLSLSACKGPPAEEQVRALVAQAVGHAEAGRVGDLLELTTSTFRAEPMKADRERTRQALQWALRAYRGHRVLYPRPAVEVEPGEREATARFSFVFVRGQDPAGDDPPARGQAEEAAFLAGLAERTNLFRLELRLLKVEDGWLIEQAFLERWTGLGFEPARGGFGF